MPDLIYEIYSSPQTAFTLQEIALLSGEDNENNLKANIHYYVTKGKIKALRKGLYVKENYNPLEVANKIYSPSYVSLETVLQNEGVIFQHYATIFLIAYLSREIQVQGLKIRYRKIKDGILSHPLGIKQENGCAIATKERAFLDALYLYKDYYFDNLKPLDHNEIYHLIEAVYKSKRLEKQVKKLLKNA